MTAHAVAGLLLAAGGGRRFGMPKALVPHRGGLLVEHALATLVEGGCAPCVVVLGAGAEQVPELGARVVVNPRWSSGLGASLRVGLAALPEAEAVVVLTVDTPGVTAAAVRRLRSLAAPAALARATYRGEPGHPVLLGRDHWAGVAAESRGDRGARDYLTRHAALPVPCEDVADGADADHPEQLR